MALSWYRLGQTEAGQPFAVDLDGPRYVRMLRGDRGLRSELAAGYFRKHNKAPSAQALADALAVIEGYARECPREAVALRVCEANGRLLLDLGTGDGYAASVGGDKWRVESRPAALFRRTNLTGPLPYPSREPGDLDALRGLINVTDKDWPVLVGWLIAALFVDISHPIALLTGEQGTGKSSATRLIRSVIDPAPGGGVGGAPRDIDALSTMAAASWIVALDNLSYITPDMSDALCRLVTGESMVRRQLYTDLEVVVLMLRRPVILNAIDAGAMRGDLADRLVTIELERIDPAARLTDDAIGRRFAEAHQTVLTGLLDLTVRVLAALPDVTLAELPRMADFARILAALDHVTSWQSLATYLSKRAAVAVDVVDGDLVAATIRDVVTADGRWQGTATQLLDVVNSRAPEHRPKGWPGSPRALAGYLRRIAPDLRNVGVEMNYATVGRAKTRTYFLACTGDGADGADGPRPNLSLLEAEKEERERDSMHEPSAPSARPHALADAFDFDAEWAEGQPA